MAKARPLSDSELRARAIARWEGEGGALAPSPSKPVLDEPALRLLARIGAAMLEQWSSLDAVAQASLARRTREIGGADDQARALQNLANFLRDHSPDS